MYDKNYYPYTYISISFLKYFIRLQNLSVL